MASATSKEKPRILSGVQPTGRIHLGNYLGALSVWREQQDGYECLFCVVDLHALTIPEVVRPDELRRKTREVCALYLASGIDPERSTIFVQSEVHEHAELAWVLGCVTPLGWLHRMTQFKTKSDQRESVGTGLLTYPVLQAADIVLYQADQVPVGQDQKQHIELARDVAQRFNQLFGETLTVPDVMIREVGARVMGLDDPTAKMSKSVGEKVKGHAIGLLDSPKAIRKAFGRAVTDSGNVARFEDASPGVLNLLTIYRAITGKPREEIEATFDGQGYGHLKMAVADVVLAELEPLQQRWKEIMDDPTYLDGVLDRGAERAREIASKVLVDVKRAVGLGR
ncbi:tryptophan--tRNA ligase [Paraliomyxa miuraensis]|uniref:tryptophan--tRNA ligase n=1 Tax=Paraliomyxa miuraensis TaxID=376150 RepID=UPI002259669A|nr:tryptophan--tRNA ligase [Paraliomyxa miuraensis]MCX4244349.1 tryptophan--tRNA ligase [Paraliomyxa miuraensis]